MIYTVILKSMYPQGKLDYGSLIWRKEGVRQKKVDYSIKYCFHMYAYTSYNSTLLKVLAILYLREGDKQRY